MSLPLLVSGGLHDQGIGVLEWPNYCTSPHDFVMTAAFIFFSIETAGVRPPGGGG